MSSLDFWNVHKSGTTAGKKTARERQFRYTLNKSKTTYWISGCEEAPSKEKNWRAKRDEGRTPFSAHDRSPILRRKTIHNQEPVHKLAIFYFQVLNYAVLDYLDACHIFE